MLRLLDRASTIAIVLGASDWTNAGFSRAYSFARSAGHFKRYLISEPPRGLGIEPHLILDLFDDPSPASSQLSRIRAEIRSLISEPRRINSPIRDILVYYIGHGIPDSNGH